MAFYRFLSTEQRTPCRNSAVFYFPNFVHILYFPNLRSRCCISDTIKHSVMNVWLNFLIIITSKYCGFVFGSYLRQIGAWLLLILIEMFTFFQILNIIKSIMNGQSSSRKRKRPPYLEDFEDSLEVKSSDHKKKVV